MACTFCEIARGHLPADIVLEDDAVLAFLDQRPLFPGHVLLVPREHVPTLADLPPELLAPLFRAAQRLARAVEAALGAEGTFVALNNRVSQSVPHLHVHVVPRSRGDGLKGFFWPRHPYPDAAARESARRAIAEAVARLGP
ncbi:MAG: HIT family protein [Acidobacteria bacterium]|nr:HIT family protein [Acidobacteriota bacterium]